MKRYLAAGLRLLKHALLRPPRDIRLGDADRDIFLELLQTRPAHDDDHADEKYYDAIEYLIQDQIPCGLSPGSAEKEVPPLTAAERVFGIFELAEAIFLELPPRDIILNQRVNRTWHSTILESTRLQLALSYKPMNADISIFIGDEDYAGRLIHFAGVFIDWTSKSAKEVLRTIKRYGG